MQIMALDSLCTITDFFTVLQISFENVTHTYMEPRGFDPRMVYDIFMVKNIETELTYRILFERIAGNAQ